MKFYQAVLISLFFFQCSPNNQRVVNNETVVSSKNQQTGGRSIASIGQQSTRAIASIDEGRPGIKLCNTNSADVIGSQYISSLNDHLNEWVNNVGEAFEGLIRKIENCSNENEYWVKSNHKEFKKLSNGCHRYICLELLDLTKAQKQGIATSNALRQRAKLEANLDNK